jgi:hypothetical protein
MREKKNYMILTFRTTTEAMTMEKQCNMNGIPGRLIPVPREITAGCGLSWRMNPEDYQQYAERMQALGLSFEQSVQLML